MWNLIQPKAMRNEPNSTAVAGTLDRHVRHSCELDFTIVAEVHEYRVHFTIYDIEGWQEGDTKGVYDSPGWHRAGSGTHPDFVDSLDDAQAYLHGEVKWDGCSNWHFDEQDRVMLHGCSRANVQRFGEVMALCWDWTAELCPAWNA